MSFRPEILTSLCVMLCSALWFSWLAADAPQNVKLVRGWNHAQAESQVEARSTASANKTLDACSLLTDIAAILGEPLQELKPSVQATSSMKVSLCLFVTRDFAKSVSLAVTTPAAVDTGARSLRALWRNQFHSPRKPEEEKRPASRKNPAESTFTSNGEPDSEAGEATSKPRAVPDLGEEAYWVGSSISGTLYVLRGNLFLRISVGAIPKESTRIAKSKSLATAILLRLPHNSR